MTPDLDKKVRDKRHQLVHALKKKIRDLPDKHWFIKNMEQFCLVKTRKNIIP